MVEVRLLDFLKNCQFADFNERNQMSYSYIEQIIPFFSNVSSKIDKFPKLYNEIEKQFFDYQAMSQNDISSSMCKAAKIGGKKLYQMDAIWGYLRANVYVLSYLLMMITGWNPRDVIGHF